MIKSSGALERRNVDVEMLFSEDLALPVGLGRLRRLVVPWLIVWRVLARSGGSRPDVVEIHEPLAAPYAMLSRWAPRRLPPCVVMSHGLEERGWIAQRERFRRTGRTPSLMSRVSVPLTRVAQARCALRHASVVMVLSTQDAEFLSSRGRVARERVARVNGGVDAALLLAERSASPSPRLLFVGSWIDRKGVPELCEAWRELSATYPGLRLTVAGTGVDAERVLRDFAPPCRAAVTVVASMDDERLGELLASHDIFVLPSWYEGMALSMLEAAAAGLACVVTSVCGALDVFRAADPRADGAILVEPHRSAAVVGAVRALVDDAALTARLGANARRRAAGFTWDHTAGQLLEAYRAALGEADDGPELAISVVIATWRRPAALVRCLAALDAQTRAAAEVVVVVRAARHRDARGAGSGDARAGGAADRRGRRPRRHRCRERRARRGARGDRRAHRRRRGTPS